MVGQGRGRFIVARTLTLTEKVQTVFFLIFFYLLLSCLMRRIFADPFFKNSATAVYLHVCSYMNLSMVFFIFFQATLHGYVLSNETVDPIIPQLISVVRNDSLLTIPTTPVCSFNQI